MQNITRTLLAIVALCLLTLSASGCVTEQQGFKPWDRLQGKDDVVCVQIKDGGGPEFFANHKAAEHYQAGVKAGELPGQDKLIALAKGCPREHSSGGSGFRKWLNFNFWYENGKWGYTSSCQ